MYSALYMECSLYISVRFIWSVVLFKACVSLLIFCLDDLSIDVSGVLKFPTTLVLQFISPFIPVNICHILMCSYVRCMYIYNFISSYYIDPLIIM